MNIKVVLDAGHSESKQGASCGELNETKLNKVMVGFIKNVLEQTGVFNVELIDREDDDKKQLGYLAKGADIFVSCHHNSFAGKGDPYSSIHTHHEGVSTSTKLLSERVRKEMQKYFPNTKQVSQPLAVLKAAQQVMCPACILVEAYFITGGYSESEAILRTKLAAYAVASGIIIYAQRSHTDKFNQRDCHPVGFFLEGINQERDQLEQYQKHINQAQGDHNKT